jgi:hypothetical protein
MVVALPIIALPIVALPIIALLLGLTAALGTILGLFVGLPMVGFLLWPLTRAVCRVARIEIDPHDEHDPVMKLEGSLAAGLGMALGVLGAVAIVGLLLAAGGSALTAARALVIAAAAGGVAGALFGGLWSFGYRGLSVAPHLFATALAAAATATALAW